jgi:hypothetical protein
VSYGGTWFSAASLSVFAHFSLKIQSTLEILIKQYKTKQTEFEAFQKKYKIQVSAQQLL